MYKICMNCGAHLDPGDRCDCERREQPEVDMVKRPVAHQRRRRTLSEMEAAYVQQRWNDFDMR